MKTLRTKIATALFTISLAFSMLADRIGRTPENEDAEFHVSVLGHDGWYC